MTSLLSLNRFLSLCLVIAAACGVVAGCQPGPDEGVSINEPAPDRSVSLSNGVVEAVIEPEVGRVMRFARFGGESVLWARDASGDEGWKNWGGDKAWWWPQDDWYAIRGGDPSMNWPPPEVVDGEPWAVVESGQGSLTMRGPTDPALRAYLRRSFELVEGEAAMLSTTALVPVTGLGLAGESGRLPERFVPWVVTQVEVDGPVYARLDEGVTTGQAWVKAMSGSATPLRLVGERWVQIDRMNDGRGYKVGLEADVLAVELVDGKWFVQRYVGSRTGGEFAPAERAHVYQDGRYVELEFIGPSTGGAGERSLTVKWELADSPPWE